MFFCTWEVPEPFRSERACLNKVEVERPRNRKLRIRRSFCANKIEIPLRHRRDIAERVTLRCRYSNTIMPFSFVNHFSGTKNPQWIDSLNKNKTIYKSATFWVFSTKNTYNKNIVTSFFNVHKWPVFMYLFWYFAIISNRSVWEASCHSRDFLITFRVSWNTRDV